MQRGSLRRRYGHARGPKEYVRLTYKPAGATRAMTVWARVMRRDADRVTYKQVSVEGDETFGEGTEASPEQTRLIVATPAEVRERPARMNLHYGMLEVVR